MAGLSSLTEEKAGLPDRRLTHLTKLRDDARSVYRSAEIAYHDAAKALREHQKTLSPFQVGDVVCAFLTYHSKGVEARIAEVHVVGYTRTLTWEYKVNVRTKSGAWGKAHKRAWYGVRASCEDE